MDDQFNSTVLRNTAALLGVLNTAVFSAEKLHRVAEERVKANKVSKEFKNALTENGGKCEITEENTTLYSSRAGIYSKATRELNKHDIPYCAVRSVKDNSVLICVPKQYERQSDAIISEVNATILPSEQSRDAFMANNLGKEIVRYNEITPAELYNIRKELADVDVSYCVQQYQHGENIRYSIFAVRDDEAKIAETVYGTRAAMGTSLGAVYAMQKENYDKVSEEVTAAATLRNHHVYIGEYKDGEGYLHVNNGSIYAGRYGQDGREEFICRTDDKEFVPALKSVLLNMKNPVVAYEEKAIELEKAEHLAGLISKQDIARAKALEAAEQGELGHVEEARILSSQIAAITISGGAKNAAEVQSLKDCVRFSESAAFDSRSNANEEFLELVHRYNDLKLSEDAERVVTDFVKGLINDGERCTMYGVVTANDLGTDDVEHWLRANDIEQDERDDIFRDDRYTPEEQDV